MPILKPGTYKDPLCHFTNHECKVGPTNDAYREGLETSIYCEYTMHTKLTTLTTIR